MVGLWSNFALFLANHTDMRKLVRALTIVVSIFLLGAALNKE